MIDMASVYAERYKTQPHMLQAAVMGQSPDPKLDPYTALNALKLVKESQRMAMAGQAQQPTSSPSIVAEALAPAPSAQGLGAMVPNTMGQGAPGAPQGLAAMAAQRPPIPQQSPMQAASGGLASMPTSEDDYAEGGIVAFQAGGKTAGAERDYTQEVLDSIANDQRVAAYGTEQEPGWYSSNRVSEPDEVDDGETGGTDTGFLAAQRLANKRIAGLGQVQRKEFDQEGFIKRYMDRVKKEGGENIYAAELARGPEDEADRARARRTGEANALFTAAGKVLKGRNLAEGASEALPAYGSSMNEVEKLDQAAKQANAKYQFALKDAQRKERMGDIRGAAAAAELARKYEQDENKFEFDKARYGAEVAVRNVQANRPLRGAGGAGDASTKLPQVDRDAAAITKQIIALEAKDPNDPRIASLRKQRQGLLEIIGVTKDVGPNKLGAQNTQIFVGAAKDSSAEARKMLYTDPVMRSNDRAAISNRYRELYAESIQRRFPNTPLSELLANMPAEELGSVAAPAAGKPAAQNALPMPASKAELKTNQLYNTNQGLAVWNGTKFVAQ
jgi:hypothetical protein